MARNVLTFDACMVSRYVGVTMDLRSTMYSIPSLRRDDRLPWALLLAPLPPPAED